jgi:hypothetical protein
MAMVTIFALVGAEAKQGLFDKTADLWFNIALTMSLVLFSVEILVNSCVVDEFKYSFFFWLDIVATLSLVPDIDFIFDFLQTVLGSSRDLQKEDVYTGEIVVQGNDMGKLTKIVKSLRLIRLVRIIKLYKYIDKSGSDAEEARLREATKLA